MRSVPAAISPTKLRSDLYNHSDHGDDLTPPLVISVLASLLERAISRNSRQLASRGIGPTKGRAFDGDRVLDMTIQSFLERIFRYTRVGPTVFVVAYVYIDRLCRFHQGLSITSRNAQRLLVTAVMVASKFLEDLNHRNSLFAEVGGVETWEMNELEVEFLFLMSFRLHVNLSVFQSYCSHLEREVSNGGGYQIERMLLSTAMCGGEEITSKERGRMELGRLAKVL